MFGFIKKLERAAVLTDKNWIKKVSEFEGMLIPGLGGNRSFVSPGAANR